MFRLFSFRFVKILIVKFRYKYSFVSGLLQHRKPNDPLAYRIRGFGIIAEILDFLPQSLQQVDKHIGTSISFIELNVHTETSFDTYFVNIIS